MSLILAILMVLPMLSSAVFAESYETETLTEPETTFDTWFETAAAAEEPDTEEPATEAPATEAPATDAPATEPTPAEPTQVEWTVDIDGSEYAVISGVLPEDGSATLEPLGVPYGSETTFSSYDLTVYDGEGEEYSPEDAVSVELHSEKIADALDGGNAVGVLKRDKYGYINRAETVSVCGDSVTFLADENSTYYLYANQIVKTLVASDGNTYRITVLYDGRAGFPEDAEIRAEEVSFDGEDYLNYLESTAATLGVELSSLTYNKLFDIAIVDAAGTEYQPNDNVRVTVELMESEAESVENLRVVHFDDEDVATELEASTNGNAVTFDTDGFSVFSFNDTSLVSAVFNAVFGEQKLYENDDIILTGRMPLFGTVEANPVWVQVDGRDALLAYDIKIYANSIMKLLGIPWQPTEGAVTVTVKSDAFADAEGPLRVYHMQDEQSEPEFVASVDAVDSSVSFEASSFSIYAIGDEGGTGDNARIGYRFWYPDENGEYQEIVTQWFRKSDIEDYDMKLYVPEIPNLTQEEYEQVFDGWHKGSAGWHLSSEPLSNPPGIEDAEVVINPVNDPETRLVLNDELAGLPNDSNFDFVEGKVQDIYAKYKKAYYITYVDVNPTYVLATDFVLKTGDSTTFTVRDSVKPTRYTEELKGWYRLVKDPDTGVETIDSSQLYTTDTTSPDYQDTYPISENIKLLPVIDGGYYLIFDDNDIINGKSGGASYTPAAFYMSTGPDAQYPHKPEDPTWAGYQFGGWYTDPECTDGNEFFDANGEHNTHLTHDTRVHAKWIPSNTTLRVVFWKQAATPNGAAVRYEYAASRLIEYKPGTNEEHIKTGDTYNLETSDTNVFCENGYAGTTNGGGYYTTAKGFDGSDKYYFTYNAAKTDTSVVAKADGSATLNVYYDRKTVTMNFYLYNRDYNYTATTSNSGTQYAFINGEWVELTRGEGTTTTEYYLYRYEGQEYTGTIYDSNGNTTTNPVYPNRYYRYGNRTGELTWGTREVTTYKWMIAEYGDVYTPSTAFEEVMYGEVNGEKVLLTPVYETTNRDVYKLTSTLTSGNDYLIVSRNNAGSGYALGHNGGTYSNDAVTVNAASATINASYITSANGTAVWTATSSGTGWKFSNGGYFIRNNDNSNIIQISTTNDNNTTWTWNGSNNLLKSGNYSLYYRGSSNRFYLRNGDYSVYLYEKTTISETTSNIIGYTYNGQPYEGNRFTYSYEPTGGTTEYTGTRYTKSTTQSDGWHLYKQYTGLYNTTLVENGYTWPTEFWWYDRYSGGTATGTRTTFKASFLPVTNTTTENYYGKTGTGSNHIYFYQQNLDNLSNYTLVDTISTESSGFYISDKYVGFHAASYSTNGTTWTSAGNQSASNGYYNNGNSVSFTNNLYIRFDRNTYKLHYHINSGTETVVDVNVLFGTPLTSYADRNPGSKVGYFVDATYDSNGQPTAWKWYTDQGYTALYDFSQTMPADDVNVYCKWIGERYRPVFIPNCNDYNLDPTQGLTFRLDYGETVSGTLLNAITRPGWIFDGWHIGNPDGEPFYFDNTPMESSVPGMDMTYWWSPQWASTRHGYEDDDGDPRHEAVHGIMKIYARWIIDRSKTGVQIIYDPGDAALTDPSGNALTTVPVDYVFYAESDYFTVREQPSNYDDLYQFEKWEVVEVLVDGEGHEYEHVFGTLDANSTNVPISSYYNHYFEKIMDPENPDTELRRVIKLRATYTKKEGYEARYTTITYDGNTFTENAYPTGTTTYQGYALDGSHRTSITLDKLTNETIVLPGANDFYMEGWELVGWSFTPGKYADQVEAETAEAPNFDPGQRVAADNLRLSELNDEDNVLYAMWQPKTYKITVKQVVETGVPVQTFNYPFKTDVQSNLTGYGTGQSLTGNSSFVVDKLGTTLAFTDYPLEYWGRKGHAIKIQTPFIDDDLDYSVQVSAIVIKDDGTRQVLEPVDGDIYQVFGDIEITYTYAMKVQVYISKWDMTNNNQAVTGAKFELTPIRYDSITSTWITVGDSIVVDLTSNNTWTKRLQEGTYRIVETQAPADYGAITETLLVTVHRDGDFHLRTLTSPTVSSNLAELVKHNNSGQYLNEVKIYDRPTRTFRIHKVVQGEDFKPNGYEFDVRITLDDDPLANYITGTYTYTTGGETVTGTYTTNSSGYLQDHNNSGYVKIKDTDYLDVTVPYGAKVEITERTSTQYMDQYTVEITATGVEGDGELAPQTDNATRKYTFFAVHEQGATPVITYRNVKIIPAPTGVALKFAPFIIMDIIGLALFALVWSGKKRRRGGGRA